MNSERAPEEIEYDDFRRRFITYASVAILAVCAVLIPLLFFAGIGDQAMYPVGGCALMIGAIVLVRYDHIDAGGLVFASASILSLGAFDFMDMDDNGIGTGMLCVSVFAVALLLNERFAWGTAVLVCLTFIVGEHNQYDVKGLPKVVAVFFESGSLLVACYVAVLFSRRIRESRNTAIARRKELQVALEAAAAIAEGDLGRTVEGNDDVSAAVGRMQNRIANLVLRLNEATGVIAPTSAEIAAMAQQNRHLATEQAGAVVETRASLESVAQTASNIADSAKGVLEVAESTSEMNQRVAERLNQLTKVYKRINRLLIGIGDVARKSEILALNAALEGVRAGEAGSGFGLVAQEMQQLAEQVAASAEDAGRLVIDIQEATEEANETFGRSKARAAETTAAARTITMATQQQRSATEQLLAAISELEATSRELSEGSEQTLASVDHLEELSSKLGQTLALFRS